jgi:signal transduction histidine kinase
MIRLAARQVETAGHYVNCCVVVPRVLIPCVAKWLLGSVMLIGLLGWWAANGQEVAPGWLPDPVLSRQQVHQLVPTAEGFWWAGTETGVYRYDGYQLTPLSALRRRGPALPTDARCPALLRDPRGTLWLGTSAGLFQFTSTGTLRALPVPDSRRPMRAISSLAYDPGAQCVWVIQEGGIARAYNLAGRPVARPLSILSGSVGFVSDGHGGLWVYRQQAHQALCFDSRTGEVRGQWERPDQGALWPVRAGGRIALLGPAGAWWPGAGGRLRPAACWDGTDPVPAGCVPSVINDSTVLVANTRELLEISLTPTSLLQVRQRLPTPLANVMNGRLWADSRGVWWLSRRDLRRCWRREATSRLLQQLAVRAPHSPLTRPADPSYYSTRAMTRLPDGRLLVSTYHGLLTQPADSPYAPLRRLTAPRVQLPAYNALLVPKGGPLNRVLAAREDQMAAAFYWIDVATSRTWPVPTRGGAYFGTSLVQDIAGRVWAGARSGLYQLDATRGEFVPYAVPGTPLSTVLALATTADGALWIATETGVTYLQPDTRFARRFGPTELPPWRLPNAVCLSVCAPDWARGRAWVGTKSAGLVELDPHRGVCRTVGVGASGGLPDSPVATILAGTDHTLWLGTYDGLVRYQPATAQLAVYTPSQQPGDAEFNRYAAYADITSAKNDGPLYFGGITGLYCVQPRAAPHPLRPPQLILTNLSLVDRQSGSHEWPLPAAAADTLAITISPAQPLGELSFALTDMFDPARARYAYRVAGELGNRWISLGNTPHLTLPGLPPGSYTLEVRGETARGQRAANLLRLPLTVIAEWWRRPGVWALAALGLVGLVYGWQQQRLRVRLREAALRTQIAADLHDDVGSLLTQISMEATLLHEGVYPANQQAARLEQVAVVSRRAARQMSDVVWSIDARNNSILSLLDRMRDHAYEVLPAAGVELDFVVEPELRALALPSPLRQSLYFIFKEALHNVVKHAHAQLVTVRLTRVGQCVRLDVRDDGRGCVGEPPPARHGLRNMRMRAEQVGGQISYDARPPGFAVGVELPLPRARS